MTWKVLPKANYGINAVLPGIQIKTKPPSETGNSFQFPERFTLLHDYNNSESEINHEQWYLCCFSIKSSPNGFHFAVTIGSEILTLEEIIRDFAQEKYRD